MSTPSQAPVVVSRIQNRRGTQTQFNNLYPIGYRGIGGFDSPGFSGFNITNYPNVLMPGELALCTDSRRIFIGNINGEYFELTEPAFDNIFLRPTTWTLPPVSVFTPISRTVDSVTINLEYKPTPFFNIVYALSDNSNPNWNTVGTNYARSGDIYITSINPAASIPVNLIDTNAEINNLLPASISFIARYNIANTYIQLLYKHNFTINLTLNISTIQWLPY